MKRQDRMHSYYGIMHAILHDAPMIMMKKAFKQLWTQFSFRIILTSGVCIYHFDGVGFGDYSERKPSQVRVSNVAFAMRGGIFARKVNS